VGDPSKKAFTYFVLTGGRFIYASAIRVTVLKFLMSMSVRALALPVRTACTHPQFRGSAPQRDPRPAARAVLAR
jgi:hypothetical protein